MNTVFEFVEMRGDEIVVPEVGAAVDVVDHSRCVDVRLSVRLRAWLECELGADRACGRGGSGGSERLRWRMVGSNEVARVYSTPDVCLGVVIFPVADASEIPDLKGPSNTRQATAYIGNRDIGIAGLHASISVRDVD